MRENRDRAGGGGTGLHEMHSRRRNGDSKGEGLSLEAVGLDHGMGN